MSFQISHGEMKGSTPDPGQRVYFITHPVAEGDDGNRKRSAKSPSTGGPCFLSARLFNFNVFSSGTGGRVMRSSVVRGCR